MDWAVCGRLTPDGGRREKQQLIHIKTRLMWNKDWKQTKRSQDWLSWQRRCICLTQRAHIKENQESQIESGRDALGNILSHFLVSIWNDETGDGALKSKGNYGYSKARLHGKERHQNRWRPSRRWKAEYVLPLLCENSRWECAARPKGKMSTERRSFCCCLFRSRLTL